MTAAGSLALAGTVLVAVVACSDSTGPEDPFCAHAPETAAVHIEDANLALAIYSALSVSPQVELTCGMVESLTSLNAGSRGIVSVAGIENLTALTTLSIRANSITDISPLRGLTGLTSLNLAANQVRDIEPLRGLTQLTFLAINDNGAIEDIAALTGLTNLTGTLWMGGNSIDDLEPLRALTGISILRAWDNDITDLGPLSGLTGLAQVHVHTNAITSTAGLAGLPALTAANLHTNPALTDIQGLLANAALGPGTDVNITGTAVSCADVDALRAKGVAVIAGCP
jgi:internalin A